MSKKMQNVSSTTEILSSANPEIFETSPRPGGFLKVMVPSKSQDYIALGGPSIGLSKCCCKSSIRGIMQPREQRSIASIGSTHSRSSRMDQGRLCRTSRGVFPSVASREFRIATAVENIDWGEMDFPDDPQEPPAEPPNPVRDAMAMLATTISCVMLMAAGLSNIPEEYFTWSESYLECMKDEDDNYPYNVMGVLNHIQFLKQGRPLDKKKCPGLKCGGARSKSGSKTPERKRSRSKGKSPKGSRAGSPHASPSTSPQASRDNVRTLTTVKVSSKDVKKY